MAKSKLDMFTKKMIKMMSLKKIQKKIMFLMKPKNLYKVLILLAILLVLFYSSEISCKRRYDLHSRKF